jgi:hypothetical protein
VGASEHGRVLSGAIVVESARAGAGFAKHSLASGGHRIVGAAGQISFLEAEIIEHPAGDRDVLRLAAMGRARQRELIVAPPEVVEAAGRQQRHDLERLGARPPMRDHGDVTRPADQRPGVVGDRGMHAVRGFGIAAARDNDIELVCLHSEGS